MKFTPPYIRSILLVFILCLGWSDIQAQNNKQFRKLTIGAELCFYPASGDYLLAGLLMNEAHSPYSTYLPGLGISVLLRLRPGLRVAYSLNPALEVFGMFSTYGTKVEYEPGINMPGSGEEFFAEGRQLVGGAGFRFYSRKTNSLAPMGSFTDVSLHLHSGSQSTPELNLEASMLSAELKFETGRQYPISNKALLTVGAGLGLTGLFYMSYEGTDISEHTRRSLLNQFLGNLFYFKTGIAIMP